MTDVRSKSWKPVRAGALLLVLATAAACAPGAPTDEEAEVPSALTGIPSTTSLGNLSLAFGEKDTTNQVGVWRDVDRLATGVWSNSGDALQIHVSARVTGKGSVYLRAFVDDQVVLPSDIELFLAGTATTSERSFTFIATNMKPGFHLVRVQWLSGDKYIMSQRSLAVRSVSTVPGQNAQLGFIVPVSGPSVHISKPGGWQAIPGLSMTMSTRQATDMQITFAAEMGVGATRFIARVLVDGVPTRPGDITMEQVDHQSEGTRSMTFSAPGVPAGTHSIVAQWYCDAGGDIWVGDRTLSAYAVVAGTRVAEGGANDTVYEGTPATVTTTDWKAALTGVVDVGLTAGDGLFVAASLEHLQSAGTGALHVRARADGRVMSPSEYVLDHEKSFDTQTLVFSTKDFPFGGYHGVTLEYRVDSGTTAQVRDMSLASSAVRRTGADFAQAQPYQNHLAPHQGTYSLLTICLDPERPGQPPLTDAVVNDVVDGSDGGYSIRGLYNEMTSGRFRIGSHWTLGCGTPSTYHPPVAHQGNYYWNTPGGFVQMRQDAIAAADPDFNFAQFDFNHDGQVLPDELDINICIPQLTPDGQAGQFASYAVDGTTLGLASVDCYMSPDLVNGRHDSVGVIAHENAHETLAAYDLYGPIPMPDQMSLMGTRNPVHLEGYDKLHDGWLSPALVDMSHWTTQTVTLPPVETTNQALIIYDPTRNHDEYFMIENRSMSTSLGITNYDSYLWSGGLVLWHIVEDPALLDPTHPPPVPGIDAAGWAQRLTQYGWVAGGIQNWGAIMPGQPITLVWANGTASSISVEGVQTDPSSVIVTKL